ncbi:MULTISPECIES: hypothetical protein [Streptomyces]|uniref:Uncharacterized protein n=1 Tax=Streptomyces harbinensis TaxID=1176198 RepID=A0A1I6WD18_9ACTN|nr:MULTISPECIES: hypothetical protein [Streptomyces]SFT23873.1 hypothetical protein SAMN05444716_1217 [Streptomyces harbinensis]
MSIWTIDSIAHALPHPELRARFARETSFTEVSKLPAIIDKWVRVVEEFEAGRARIEALAAHQREHGQLPTEYETRLTDITTQLQADADRTGRSAA